MTGNPTLVLVSFQANNWSETQEQNWFYLFLAINWFLYRNSLSEIMMTTLFKYFIHFLLLIFIIILRDH